MKMQAEQELKEEKEKELARRRKELEAQQALRLANAELLVAKKQQEAREAEEAARIAEWGRKYEAAQ